MENRTIDNLGSEQILAYRKVALAVVGCYVGLSREFVEAVLHDEMDEYFESQEFNRETLRATDFKAYLEVISKECVVRYAATAAEALAAPADSDFARCRTMGDAGLLGLTDDMNAVARVEQILEPVVPDGFREEEGEILVGTMRGLCDFYNSVAYRLVHEDLVEVIVEATEMLLITRRLSYQDVHSLVKTQLI